MGGGGMTGGSDTRFLRQENIEMSRQLELQSRDLRDREKQLLEYRRSLENVIY